MINKQQREHIRLLFNGHCAYCGQELGAKWHADHIEPVERELSYTTFRIEGSPFFKHSLKFQR